MARTSNLAKLYFLAALAAFFISVALRVFVVYLIQPSWFTPNEETNPAPWISSAIVIGAAVMATLSAVYVSQRFSVSHKNISTPLVLSLLAWVAIYLFFNIYCLLLLQIFSNTIFGSIPQNGVPFSNAMEISLSYTWIAFIYTGLLSWLVLFVLLRKTLNKATA